MPPILFEFGPFHIATYGLMLAIGFLAGLFILRRELVRKGLAGALADRIVMAAMIGGIVGGKLFHILEYPHTFLEDPTGMIFSGYGLAWYGGFLGGTAAVLWTLRRHGALDLSVLDAAAPALTAGYFFGRSGCQLSGDGCYGIPTDLPWGMTFEADRLCVPRHPSQLYEAALEGLALFAIINIATWKFRSLEKPGLNAGLFLVFYGLFRALLETVREPDAHMPEALRGYVTMGLLLSLPMIALGVWLIHRAMKQDSAKA